MTAADAAAAQAKTEAKAEEAADRRRLLFTGDAQGSLVKLFSQVENQQKKVGAFHALLAAGAFLPAVGGEGAAAAAAALAEYASGKRKAPVDTYFIESRSAAFIQAAPEGRQLCERVHFLGGYGIREIDGLRVAFLSGHYDAAVYSAQGAQESGPAFVGAAYTPHAIDALVRLSQDAGSPPIDVLLTAEWPTGIEQKLDDADQPRDPDAVPIDWKTVSAPPIAELVSALEPRYHVFSTADVFYQRPPFQTRRSGHVCRCVGLGKVGSKGKGRLWVHALSLLPAKGMPQQALMQRPANTTPSPFAGAAKMQGQGMKRESAKMEEDGAVDETEGEVELDKVFVSRLPANISEKRLESAFKTCGKIERIHLARDEAAEGKPCKGFGWVTFSTPEEAEAACDLNEMLECGGRKISVCLSKKSPNQAKRQKREIQIVIEPHADCWFCLVNPKVEKHMIVTATPEVYVATAKGPIHPQHAMVLPVKHAPCFAACPPELQTAIAAHVQAIRQMFNKQGKDCFVWERWIPMSVSAANHMQIQIVPVDRDSSMGVREVLEEAASKYLPGVTLKRVQSHAEVAENVNDDSATPYVYFEIPGDNSAKGRMIERYMYAGVDADGPRIPVNFCRQVACRVLDCVEKVDWRQCTDDRDEEKDLAAAFREQLKPFEPKKKK